MVFTFIISKKSIHYELIVSEDIQVKPLEHDSFSLETLQLLAKMHRVLYETYLAKHKRRNCVTTAIYYFQHKGFEIRIKERPKDIEGVLPFSHLLQVVIDD
jgi:hypothetical protein